MLVKNVNTFCAILTIAASFNPNNAPEYMVKILVKKLPAKPIIKYFIPKGNKNFISLIVCPI